MSATGSSKGAHLRVALQALEELPAMAPGRPELIEAAVESLMARSDTGLTRPRDDRTLDVLHAELTALWKETHSLDHLPARLLKRASWILFYPPREPERWPGQDLAFARAFLAWIVSGARGGVASAAIREFLQSYPRGTAPFEPWRVGLKNILTQLEDMRVHRWGHRNAGFHLLEENGPARFAEGLFEELTRQGRSVDQFLADAGLTGGLASSGFVEGAVVTFLKCVEERLRQKPAVTDAELGRYLSVIIGEDGSWRFPEQRTRVATALLSPFIRTEPPDGLRLKIEQFLVQYYRDPRLYAATWAGVDPACVAVLKRWLAGKTFDLFFEILAQSADRKDHWEERREFWGTYLHSGHIHEAWVILGPEAQLRARKAAKHKHLAFGVLRRTAGVDPTHSVLLMRVVGPDGELVVTEWSHMGTCRFWYGSAKSKPVFYREVYLRTELVRNPSDEARHYRGWQYNVKNVLRKRTGV